MKEENNVRAFKRPSGSELLLHFREIKHDIAYVKHLPRICTLMVAEAEPMAFLSFNS